MLGSKKTVRIEDFRILRFFPKNLLNLSKKLLDKDKTYDHNDFADKIQKKSPTNDNVQFRNNVVFEVTTFAEKKLSCRKHLLHQPRIIFTAIGFCVPMLGCTNFVNSSFHGTNFANWIEPIESDCSSICSSFWPSSSKEVFKLASLPLHTAVLFAFEMITISGQKTMADFAKKFGFFYFARPQN